MNIGSQYLDGEYHEKNPTYHVQDSPWKAREIVRFLKQKNIHPKRIAEVGCGAGEILNQLSKHLPEVLFFGYEINPQGYSLCKQRKSERVKYYNSDFLEQDDEPYDLVLCLDVFEHVEDCFTFLRKLSKQGTSFLFFIPLDMNVQMVLRSTPILKVRQKIGHLHYFSKDTALAVLKDCGYRIDYWCYLPSAIDQPKSIKAKIFSVPRRLLFRIHRDMAVRILGGYCLLVYACKEEPKPFALPE